MDPPRFDHHYRRLFFWLRLCGLPTPWLKKSTMLHQLPFLCYDAFVVVMVCCTLQFYTYSIIHTPYFQDLCILGISSTCFVCGLLVTIYHILYREQLKIITDDMDTIAETIFQNELGGTELINKLYRKNTLLMKLLTDSSLFISFITPIIYCWSVPVLDWRVGEYRANLPMPVVSLYNDKMPVIYELTVLSISCSIAVSTSKKSATDCLFISLFNIQSAFLKYLSIAKHSLQKDFLSGDDVLVRRKLIMWARLHQEILKNIEKLIAIFSPVVVIYSASVIIIVVCGAFVQIKKDNDNLIQSLSIGSYVVITIVSSYLLSNTANELTAEAQHLAFVAYSMPWYRMEKINTFIIQMVQIRANRRINITAYKAPIFLLNRETFAGFMVRAISAFVTFCQLKDIYG